MKDTMEIFDAAQLVTDENSIVMYVITGLLIYACRKISVTKFIHKMLS